MGGGGVRSSGGNNGGWLWVYSVETLPQRVLGGFFLV